ncbi:MAG TPA: OsmC family protein [Nakamurella sp.]
MTTRWTGGMRAITRAGDFDIVVDEPETSGGTNSGPQPTDLLLASLSSCFALALAFTARKRGIDLPGLTVTATGTYDGPSFTDILLTVVADTAPDVVERLIPHAQRVCYVTNTLRRRPEITVALG